MDEEKRAAELAEAVANGINSMCFDYEAFCHRMSREHRALQQDFTTLCFKWLKTLSEMYKNGSYDARNEYACKMANKIVENFKEEI